MYVVWSTQDCILIYMAIYAYILHIYIYFLGGYIFIEKHNFVTTYYKVLLLKILQFFLVSELLAYQLEIINYPTTNENILVYSIW